MSNQSQRDRILALSEELSLSKERESKSLKPEDYLSQYLPPHDLLIQKRLHAMDLIAKKQALDAEKAKKEQDQQRFIKGLLGA